MADPSLLQGSRKRSKENIRAFLYVAGSGGDNTRNGFLPTYFFSGYLSIPKGAKRDYYTSFLFSNPPTAAFHTQTNQREEKKTSSIHRLPILSDPIRPFRDDQKTKSQRRQHQFPLSKKIPHAGILRILHTFSPSDD